MLRPHDSTSHIDSIHTGVHKDAHTDIQADESSTSYLLKNKTQITTSVSAPATCGELAQGAINNRDFLVNCPIDLYATANLSSSDNFGLAIENSEQYKKIDKAMCFIAQKYGISLAHTLKIHSPIPRGKGMASSTADITSALSAMCRQQGLNLSNDELFNIIVNIEPSDGTHFPNIAYINHLSGELYEILPAPKGLRVLVVDCGGEVDTVNFDRSKARHIYRDHQNEMQSILTKLKRGLTKANNKLIAEAATDSSMFNQKLLYKPQLEDLLGLALTNGALGVNCAHSGTVLGVLYEPQKQMAEILKAAITRGFGEQLTFIGDHQIFGGGCVEH